jgi:hypothetical protein
LLITLILINSYERVLEAIPQHAPLIRNVQKDDRKKHKNQNKHNAEDENGVDDMDEEHQDVDSDDEALGLSLDASEVRIIGLV